jgi:hypothetical protein
VTLGRLGTAWVEGHRLYGELQFHHSAPAQLARGKFLRSELRHVIGYSIHGLELTDARSLVRDIDDIFHVDDALTFVARRWELHEVRLRKETPKGPRRYR